MRRLLTFTLIIAALLAARCFAWAETALEWGALTAVNLDAGEQVFTFSPGAGSVYDICLFPAEASGCAASATLFLGDEPVAEGDGSLTLLTARLRTEATYTLRLTGTGRGWLDITRNALSRCFDAPLALSAAGDSYSKVIARGGDAHWYALTGQAGRPLLLAGLPEEPGLRLKAWLFDDSGLLLAEATPTAGGAFLMDYTPRDDRACRVRVAAEGSATGMYSLRAAPSEGGLPEALTLAEPEVSLNGHESRQLVAVASPEGAAGALLWESSDEAVVRVSQSGVVTGMRPGTAVVTAYAAGAVRARCRVDVARVPVAGLSLITSDIRLNAGDDLALEWSLIPENASDTRVSFEVMPAGIVEVDESGVLRALEAGTADVVVRTGDGGFEAVATVNVLPALPRCRALLIGEQNYAATVASVRLGSANSVTGMRGMLETLSCHGARFEVETRLDASRDAVLSALRTAFDGATEQDFSLFYITCHGDYFGGMTRFWMYDGSILTAQELRQALDRVPGEVLLLVDCCGSGGVIGGAGTPDDILLGVREVFGGMPAPSLFAGSRFRVLASAAPEQNSYRVRFEDAAAESDMATVFARAVCEGCGWSIDRGQRGPMRADTDYDGAVSLDELYAYAARRVTWYLSLGGGDYAQTVRVSPEGDARDLFGRD